jgi:hypothetical protein
LSGRPRRIAGRTQPFVIMQLVAKPQSRMATKYISILADNRVDLGAGV